VLKIYKEILSKSKSLRKKFVADFAGFLQILWHEAQNPLKNKGLLGHVGGADGNDLTSFDRTLCSNGYPGKRKQNAADAAFKVF
jgi:hypothetical protein